MTQLFMKGAVRTIPTGCFSMESRLRFEGVAASKEGIRYHHFIIAFILRLFSDTKIVDIKDVDEKVYHVNRGSLSDWLRKNHEKLTTASKEGMLNVSEGAMREWLDEVLAKKSPRYIVKISQIKNELVTKIEQKETIQNTS